MPIERLVPVSLSDIQSNLPTGVLTNIDNGVDTPSGTFLESVQNEWNPAVGTGSSATFTMSNLPGEAATINTVRLRMRAEVPDIGGADDTYVITFQVLGSNVPTSLATGLTWGAADEAAGFSTNQTAAESTSATPANVTAWTVRIHNSSWTRNMGADDMSLRIDELEIEVDYAVAAYPYHSIHQRRRGMKTILTM